MVYYGHGAWLGVVVFVGFFAMRMLSQRRRRGYGGYGRPPVSGNSFSRSSFSSPAAEPSVPPQRTGDSTFTGIAPGWLADPFAKHEQRYWSGTHWTEHVVDNGVPGTDPPPSGGSEDRH